MDDGNCTGRLCLTVELVFRTWAFSMASEAEVLGFTLGVNEAAHVVEGDVIVTADRPVHVVMLVMAEAHTFSLLLLELARTVSRLVRTFDRHLQPAFSELLHTLRNALPDLLLFSFGWEPRARQVLRAPLTFTHAPDAD